MYNIQSIEPIQPIQPIQPIPQYQPNQPIESCCSIDCCNNTINKMCFKLYKDRSDIESILNNIDLSHIQKQHIQARYINMLENFKKRTRKYSMLFFIGHFIITVGSLFVPALLSIQNSNVSFSINGYSIPVYILTFIVSLLVTIFNGILTLFKIDKKYYFLNTIQERLRSEGWQYLGLSGRYSGKLQNIIPTYNNQFLYFIHQIEKIKMKQVEEEYHKTNDPEKEQSSVKQNELYPPSLTQSITSLASTIPEPVREAMQSIIKSQNIVSEPQILSLINEYSNKLVPTNSIIIPSPTIIPNSIIIPSPTISSNISSAELVGIVEPETETEPVAITELRHKTYYS